MSTHGIEAHLMDCTRQLMQEIESPVMGKRDVAQTYALALRSRFETDWSEVHRAIIDRWSESALEDIKRWAESGSCFGETADA